MRRCEFRPWMKTVLGPLQRGWFHGWYRDEDNDQMATVEADNGHILVAQAGEIRFIDTPQTGLSDDELRATFAAAALTGLLSSTIGNEDGAMPLLFNDEDGLIWLNNVKWFDTLSEAANTFGCAMLAEHRKRQGEQAKDATQDGDYDWRLEWCRQRERAEADALPTGQTPAARCPNEVNHCPLPGTIAWERWAGKEVAIRGTVQCQCGKPLVIAPKVQSGQTPAADDTEAPTDGKT